MAEEEVLRPLSPGQAPKPNNRVGPPVARAFASGRAYWSVGLLENLQAANAERNHAAPQVEAMQLYPDAKQGRLYAVPCPKEAEGAYILHFSKSTREAWVSFLEVYDEFNIKVPTRSQFVIEGERTTHPQLGPCVVLHLAAAQQRPIKFRPPVGEQAAAARQ